MIPLFSKSGLVLLESLSFTRTLYSFDFDGTLSRIVRIPDAARISSTTESLLQELSEVAPVAIVSGRSIGDLKKRIRFKPQYLVGNHGLEGLGKDGYSLSEADEQRREWRSSLERWDFGNGVEIEDKKYSLAIHFRRSRNKKWVRAQVGKAISALKPVPRLIPGKAVFNLVPGGAPHKGAAVLELMHQAGAKRCLYIGDDDTDEDVFTLHDPSIVTVRVGRRKSSGAKYFISRQTQINQLLKLLVRYHRSFKTVGAGARVHERV